MNRNEMLNLPNQLENQTEDIHENEDPISGLFDEICRGLESTLQNSIDELLRDDTATDLDHPEKMVTLLVCFPN